VQFLDAWKKKNYQRSLAQKRDRQNFNEKPTIADFDKFAINL
jgi:hypothetical protein